MKLVVAVCVHAADGRPRVSLTTCVGAVTVYFRDLFGFLALFRGFFALLRGFFGLLRDFFVRDFLGDALRASAFDK